jgi:hypothetical protein
MKTVGVSVQIHTPFHGHMVNEKTNMKTMGISVQIHTPFHGHMVNEKKQT